MDRKTAEIASRREFILGATRKLFADKGVETVSMDDIAAAADYTRRTIYNYFASFDEICLTIYIQDQNSRWEKQQAAIAAAGTGLAKLHAWADALCLYRKQNPHYGSLEAYWDFHGMQGRGLSRSLFARFKKINNELAQGLREIFRLGSRDKTMRADLDVDLCISQFLYSYRAILRRAESSSYSFAQFEPDQYVKHYLELFTRAICNKGVN